MAAKLVVGLPQGDGRVSAIALRHRGDDPHAFVAIAFVAKIVMPPRSKAARATLLVNRDHIGHGVDQPFGRRRGGRAEDDLQSLGV